ncbi:ABC transporter substrate-binding protein [Paenibacillus sp. HWE-109]|uniref:ABC transporter substrate-binding protein n=1 Tax=Paenibacillus sp. HWE-109 TaxID=1306526 RepID=UPI001EDFBD8F|nr:ABC transporter substrate-binding protein [Paenibacillus sp. HWE-109]UKS29760.1 ABC transporter substrate-binding protein [Paenibacillus sp. HWE-109]
MKIRKHYLTLRRAFPHIQEESPIEITLEELASCLDCTHRNMVLVLKRMQQEGWLTWLPKKGRSNRSSLFFHAKKESILLEEAKELVARQDLHSALELLQASEEALSLREQFQDWLSGQFGFRSEVQNQRRTDVLRFPLTQTIHTLDPAAIHYAGESHLVNQLFDGLVRMDAKGDQILPHLAHAWETDDARTLWTFYLRKGVQFHHGREMLASDVKYSLERLQRLAPRGLYSWAYANICEITTPDETTVRIQLKERNELFLGFLTTNRASIVPADVYVNHVDGMNASPVGTGPFRLTGQEQGIWILEAFPFYFQGRGFLDRVEVWTLPEQEQTDLSDQLRPYQIMHNVRISDMDAERWQQVRQSGMTTKFLTVNALKDGPLKNPQNRQVLSNALDRTFLLEQLSGDVIETANSFFPYTQSDVPNSIVSTAPTTGIVENYCTASYQGEHLTLATIPQYEHDALHLQRMYAKSGIMLDIMLIPAEEFKGEQRMSADLVLFAIMLDEHRELRLYDMYKSMRQHADQDVQALLDDNLFQLRLEPDAGRRKALLEQLESQLKQRHSLLFLYRKHLKTAYHPSIRGISLDSLGWVRFRDIWFT